jgi:hypothetical protein
MSHPSHHHCFIFFVGHIREEVMSHSKIEKKNTFSVAPHATGPFSQQPNFFKRLAVWLLLLLVVVFGLPPPFFQKRLFQLPQVPNTRSIKLKLVELEATKKMATFVIIVDIFFQILLEVLDESCCSLL